VVRREDLLNEVGVQFSKRYGVEHRVVVLDVSREDFIGRLASAANDLDIGLVVSNAGTGNPGELLKLDRQLLEKTLRLNAMFYQLYFQTPGVAEAELQRDVRATIAKLLYSASGDVPRAEAGCGSDISMVSHGGGFLARMLSPDVPLAWLSDADLGFYTGEFARTRFRGSLNWFRNLDRNWEPLAPFAGAKVIVPAVYMAGDRDLVVAFRNMDKAIANLADHVPRLRGAIMLPGCGHWTQQERAAAVNATMIDFLGQL
jgi:pimeloyl-ACP methyl ester carboxylesterase